MIDSKYTEYAKDVLEGKIVAGELIKLACQRYLNFFEREDLYFDTEKADKPLRFIAKLKHNTGKFVGHPFILQDWQRFIIYAIFGFYKKEDDTRLCRSSYIQIARKCGKTSFASAIGLYGLVADGESGAEVTCVAPSAAQSRIAFKNASEYVGTINRGNILKCLTGEIRFDHTHSRFRIMSSSAKFGDGFNPSLAIIDEYHALPNNDIPNLLISGTGMRRQPLMIYITTAGFNLYSACHSYRNMCEEILRGLKEDDSIFPFIYELDPSDNWEDSTVWKKCCPSLDITVTKDYMERQLLTAKNNPVDEISIKTKTFNIWCSSKEVWLQNDLLLKVSKDIKLEDYGNKGLVAYAGIDLAAVSDLACLSILFQYENNFYFKTWAFVPETQLTESLNKELYKKWKREGNLIVTHGNVTDYDYILKQIQEINKVIPIVKVSYDSWNATQFAISATEQGLNMSPYSQALGNFNKPTKEFERLVKSGKVVIDNSELVRWCFNNAVLKSDFNENCKPIKGDNRNNKIDAVISMLTALGGLLEEPFYMPYFEAI